MNKYIDNNVIDRIKSINWFYNSGNKSSIDTLSSEIGIEISLLRSWDEAREYCQDIVWENLTLDSRNDLTTFLNTKFKNEYQLWNKITDFYKGIIDEEIIPIIDAKFEDKGLFQDIKPNIEWDLLGVFMFFAYKKYYRNRDSVFFKILKVYELGHFPSGWIGRSDEGVLLIY